MLLTLAILPIGVIVLMQSRDATAHAREMSQSALLGEAIRAAAAQRAVIRTAQGQARALVPLVQSLPPNARVCSELMREVVKAADGIEFAGFAMADGRLECTSDKIAYDLSRNPLLTDTSIPARVVSGGELSPLPGTLLIVQPVNAQVTSEAGIASLTVQLGTILLGLPRRALLTSDAIPGNTPVALDLATLNRAGELLWTSPFAPGTVVGPIEEAAALRLPVETDIGSLTTQPAHSMTALSGAGDSRLYAAVPVIEGEIVTLAAWQPGSLFEKPLSATFPLTTLLPLAMWLVSLMVAYFTVNRLILMPLSSLQGRMQAFTAGDRMLPPFRLEGAPDELAELADTFDAMTARIVRDETRLEKAVHDQKVLLKEVHHRVKNNLQLIASILNMQIRQHRTPENRAVLRRVQDRVMSLATVHQHLYKTPALSALQADTLVSEIVNRKLADASSVAPQLEVETRYGAIQLYPDQAVPLSLLVGEAVTNVFHHIGRPLDGSSPWMRLSLEQDDTHLVTLEVSNSIGTRLADTQVEFRAGLGTRLIEAFAQQLEGEVTRETVENDSWTLRLTFLAQGFDDGSGEKSTATLTDTDHAGAVSE